jgi:ATP-dependent RNA helicase RhlE
LNQRQHDSAFDNRRRGNDKTIQRSDNGFDDLGIAPRFMKALDRLHFAEPTPIQAEAIPAGIDGEDILAIARTGSGKTLAYGIPMVQRLSKMKRSAGLVIVPTRELAIQVDEAIKAIGRAIHMRSVVVIGGASINMQVKALQKNPRIIIATPGRLMDHIARRSVDLANIEIFVLDEADRMLDMGFAPDIRKIMKSIPDQRQTMLFSATMPKEIEAMAGKLMKNPTRIEIDRSGVTPAEVSHELFFIPNQDKSRLLAVQLKRRSGPVLVFTRTKRMASRLTQKVNRMGFAAAEIHSDRTLGQRQRALAGFKRGQYQILIATDIAARGIDVTGIQLVVNYDMPANSEDYVHRIGRTGRAGKTGHAISFATRDQKDSIRHLERFMKTKLAISALPTLFSPKRPLRNPDPSPPKSEYSKTRPTKRRDFNRSKAPKFGRKRTPSRPAGFRTR